MDVISTKQKIEGRINKLQEAITRVENSDQIEDAIKKMSNAKGAYERAMAITMINLKNGVELELDGEKIKNPGATMTEKIARGICFQEKIDMELAEAELKGLMKKIDIVMAQLNGYQSINKFSG